MIPNDSFLPGLRCIDEFALNLALSLEDKHVTAVALGPHRDPERSFRDVAAACRQVDGPVLSKIATFQAAEGLNGFLIALSNTMGWDVPADLNPEQLLLGNVNRLVWPPAMAVAILPAGLEEDQVFEVWTTCLDIAEATKNLEGALSFLLFMPHGIRIPCGMDFDVWGPSVPYTLPLPFRRPDRSLVETGFNVYLSHRIYWEASGQSPLAERIAGFAQLSPSLSSSMTIDERLEQTFDRVHAEDKNEDHYLEAFDKHVESLPNLAMLRQGILPAGIADEKALSAEGVVWHPPQDPRPLLTCRAAFSLANQTSFRRRTGLTSQESVKRFRRAVRRSPLLSSWVLGLTALVERELAEACRGDSTIAEKIKNLGLQQKLQEEKSRTPTELIFAPSEDLIDYASFGELQRLVGYAGNSKSFPISMERLDRIRRTRNLCAHLKAVSWTAAKTILSVLEKLYRKIDKIQ